MRTNFKSVLIILFSISLSACEGFDFDSDVGSSSPDHTFTRSELAFNVLFSSILLNDSGLISNRDGFIVLFNSSADLDEIELRDNDNDDVLVGNYAWTIVNDELQVTYPGGITCTSTKTSDTSTQYTATSTCDGGEPDNDRITSTLNKPITFDEDDLSSRTVNIDNGSDDKRIDFFSNGTFEITDLDSNGDEVSSTTKSGVFNNSDFNNVVKLVNSDSITDEYSLLVLLEGSLTTGTMLHLRYTASTDTLNEVLIYTIDTNNRWDMDSLYDTIKIDE